MLTEILSQIQRIPRRDAESLRALRRPISKKLATAEAPAVLALALDLIHSELWPARLIAYEIVKHHPAAAAVITATEVERLGEGISDWGAVDCFACYICGPAWRTGRISDSRIHRWARSKDRWWRRAALVSTVPLNVRAQGGSGDAGRTLAVCSLLVDDHEETIVKAMSWALRALAVRVPKAVEAFLDEHDGSLAALVKREVRNKLRTGRKNPGKSKRGSTATGAM